MVFMDNHQQPRSIRLIKRLIIIMAGISFLYIGVIRPTQSILIEQIVAPHFESILQNHKSISLASVDTDQIEIVGSFPKTKFELPFNGWFWLTLGLFLTAGQSKMIRIMTFYHLGLFVILYIGMMLIINGWTWLAYIFNLHEHIYKVLFLVLGLVGLKSITTQNKLFE